LGQAYPPVLPSRGSAVEGLQPQSSRQIQRPDPPPPGIVLVRGIVQKREGEFWRLRQNAEVESTDYYLKADEIDYSDKTGVAEARGHVYFANLQSGEELWAGRVDYNLNDGTGTFYEVRGSAYAKIEARQGILTTGKPFVFQGNWAEKLKDRYILHNGSITNCDEQKPWWVLTAPAMDIIPNNRALAYQSLFKLRGVPLLYAPVFYKDLSEGVRRSGFLTPNVGNSNRRGFMVGVGYYWAINRSYDLMYRPQYFTQRGFAHTVDFRGKPTRDSDFNAYFYGVNDKGLELDDGTRDKQGGYLMAIQGKALLPAGFYARGAYNYLSSFEFRQAFTESFNEAVFSEVNSVVQVSKDWSSYHLNFVVTRQENYQSDTPGDTILIRKLPQVEFDSRYRELSRKVLPLWVSWSTSAGLLRRTEPSYQTRQFVERLDAEPRLMTALRWKDVHIIPSVSLRNTYYGSSFLRAAEEQQGTQVSGQNLNRFTRQFGVELILPTVHRVFDAPKWMGSKVKHSIEPRASFKSVAGVKDFQRIIRFDDTDLLANTTEVDYSITNRLWTKSRDGVVRDWMSWEIRQRRFLDPEFGGAIVNGQRNVFLSSTELTAYAFLDQARHYSPIVNVLRSQPLPRLGVEWRGDYDPLRGRLTNSSVTADTRSERYFFSLGHTTISCVPLVAVDPSERDQFCASAPSGQVLSPASNQLRATVGLGNERRRGWNAGVYVAYDHTTDVLQYINTQLTYNTSCCAFSGQYRRFNFGTRTGENQFRVAMVIANIGSFGTLKRQERLF
jgi:LPS-assembly protein